MATKFLSTKKFLSANKHLRLLSTASSSTTTSSFSTVPISTTTVISPTSTAPPPSILLPSTKEIIDLNDHQSLYAKIPTSKLIHSSLMLYMASIGPMVDFGAWLMNSKAMEVDVLRDVVLDVVKQSFYKHFCAGKDPSEAALCAKRLNEIGLRGMLDFAVEFTDDNSGCDRNLIGFLQTVDSATSLPPSSISSVVAKITALCPLRLLERISDLLRWEQQDSSIKLPWKEHNFPVFAQKTPLYHTQKRPDPLTPQEENDLQLAKQRLFKLTQKCLDSNLPLTIDAEHTVVQPAIDYFTYLSAINFKHDGPIVYNTMQTYLKDAKERLFLACEEAERLGIAIGFKVVRGAYMSSESKLASDLGFESPIHDSIQDTHDCYNDCAAYMLDRIDSGRFGLILATHNVESGKLAARKAKDLGMGKENSRLEFAQLYGMADAYSFGLRNAGFNVSKYMPFGPVEMVIPYLLRRAEENRGLLSTSSIDRVLMRKEIIRRTKAAFA